MLTVILCVIGIIIFGIMIWNAGDNPVVIVYISVILVLFFGGIIYPLETAHESAFGKEPIHNYEITEIEGIYYFYNNGRWVDVLDGHNIVQADVLEVVEYKADKSIWYWPRSYTEVRIPIVANKYGKDGK